MIFIADLVSGVRDAREWCCHVEIGPMPEVLLLTICEEDGEYFMRVASHRESWGMSLEFSPDSDPEAVRITLWAHCEAVADIENMMPQPWNWAGMPRPEA